MDGELVALDDTGRPDFNLLQNLRGEPSHIHYYIFDLLCYRNSDLTQLPLLERRELLKALVRLPDRRIKIADDSEVAPTDLLSAVRERGLDDRIETMGTRNVATYHELLAAIHAVLNPGATALTSLA